jgi:hypothetical protein
MKSKRTTDQTIEEVDNLLRQLRAQSLHDPSSVVRERLLQMAACSPQTTGSGRRIPLRSPRLAWAIAFSACAVALVALLRRASKENSRYSRRSGRANAAVTKTAS